MTTVVVVVAVVAYLTAAWFIFRGLLRVWLNDFGTVDSVGVVWAALSAAFVPVGLLMLAVFHDWGERDLTEWAKRVTGGRP